MFRFCRYCIASIYVMFPTYGVLYQKSYLAIFYLKFPLTRAHVALLHEVLFPGKPTATIFIVNIFNGRKKGSSTTLALQHAITVFYVRWTILVRLRQRRRFAWQGMHNLMSITIAMTYVAYQYVYMRIKYQQKIF